MRVAALAILSILLVNCGETRKPVGIDVQSNDSTLNSDQRSADTEPTSRKGFSFVNPVTGLEVPGSFSVPQGSAIRLGFRLVGVRQDDYTIGFTKNSSPRMQVKDGIISSLNLPAGVHEFQLVARNTRACAAAQRSSSSDRKSTDEIANLRCDVTGVEVSSANFDFDLTETVRVTAGAAPSSGSTTQSNSQSSGAKTDSELDNRINSQFGLRPK